MRALRLLVIVLGVLLVGGMLALVGAIIVRSSQPSQPRGAPRTAPSAASPYDAVLDLPPGAVVQSAQPVGDRLVIHLVLPEGREKTVVFDLGSRSRPGTVELRPAHRKPR